jgi:hypothetical protein
MNRDTSQLPEGEHFTDYGNFNLVNLTNTMKDHDASSIFSKCWIARDTKESSPMFLAIMSNSSPSLFSRTPPSSISTSTATSTSSSSSSSPSPLFSSSLENDKMVVVGDNDDDVDDDDSKENGRYVLRVPFHDMKLGEVAVEADVGLCHSFHGDIPHDDILCWDTEE